MVLVYNKMTGKKIMKELKEKKILEVALSQDKDCMFFTTEEYGEPRLIHTYEVYGDCCTSCWIYEILNPENIIGQKIWEIEEKKLPSIKDEDGYGVTDIFGYTLRSSKGDCDIIFRAYHNGHYGGDFKYVGALITKKDFKYMDMFEKREIINKTKDK